MRNHRCGKMRIELGLTFYHLAVLRIMLALMQSSPTHQMVTRPSPTVPAFSLCRAIDILSNTDQVA